MNESEGKSGSFFFYSHDRKYLVKTITNEELNTFITILDSYSNYISKNKDTLITKIYGLFSIEINVSKINFILMQNLINCDPSHIIRIFDLKGSTIKRTTPNVEKWKKTQTLKDCDYQWLIKVDKNLVNFNYDQRNVLLDVLENDLNFFKKLNLMDYSLLFIIIDFPKQNDPDYLQILNFLGDSKYFGHVFKSKNMKYIYIVGIIDYLQEYNIRKIIENKYKKFIYGDDIINVSSVEPNFYAERFYNFMKNYLFIYGEDQ